MNLKRLDALEELELSTFVIGVLPHVLKTIKSRKLKRIRFFILTHVLEEGVNYSGQQSWAQLDFELCALADRVQANKRYNDVDLQVNFSDNNPATPAWSVEDVARQYFPSAYEHSHIAFSVG